MNSNTDSENIDWNSEGGRVFHLVLSIVGGLKYQELTENEKALMIRYGYKVL